MRETFGAASRPFLSSPWPWVAWGIVLPAAALLTPAALAAAGPGGVLFLWSAAILTGGAVEGLTILRRRDREGSTPLASWVLRIQGNLSLVAVALSLFLLWAEAAWALPGVWLLLLGHSLYVLGGFALPPLRWTGLAYQIGGAAALVPGWDSLAAFALTTAAANLWAAAVIWRRRPRPAR